MYAVLDIETYKDLSDSQYISYKIGNIEAPRNYTKQESIDKYIAEATVKAHEKLALSPLTGKIIYAGILLDEGNYPKAQKITFNNTDYPYFEFNARGESVLLTELLFTLSDLLDNGYTLITYNGKSFDLPFIMKRSVFRGIEKPKYLNYRDLIAKYNTPHHIDLFAELNGYKEYTSLTDFAYKCEITTELGSDGAKVGTWYEAGDYNSIAQHCKDDNLKTYLLFQKFQGWLL